GFKVYEYSYYCSYPRDKFPMEKAKIFVRNFSDVYRNLEEASRCDYCDFQHQVRGNRDPISILLPEIQEARDLARGLQVKARYEIYTGQYAEAIQTLRVGYALAKNISDQPFIVSQLVGIAINDAYMNECLREFVQQPDAPNLYWTITALPTPPFHARGPMKVEMDTLRLMLPELVKAMDSPNEMTDDDWRNLNTESMRKIQEFTPLTNNVNNDLLSQETTKLISAGLSVATYPKAKQWLINQGKTSEEVNAMSTQKVIGLYSVFQFEKVRDECLKKIELPYWQSKEIQTNWEDFLKDNMSPLGALVSLMFPAVEAYQGAITRSTMNQDIMRIVEACRIYAAENDGKLPEKLEDIKSVPIPHTDPFSGKPYNYKIVDGAAWIDVDLSYGTRRTEIRIKK
ncbi:MAG: hypothetical protein ACRC2T_01535, partial [Thermoguttaceae bacterium]